ncbi:hypothetical protein [Acetobacterium sp.]|uniref:hypothetical protein n=1 Tax=Acetobacterium sp. TaxID=1872094 RepID=UPI002F3ED0EA
MQELKNPEKQNIILALIAAAIGVIVVFIPFAIKILAPFQFYFGYFGILIIVFGLGYAIFSYRRYKQFIAFSENKDEALVWEYNDGQYTAFVSELTKIQRAGSKKKILLFLGIELVISIILFVFLSPEMKWFSVLLFIVVGGFSLISTLIFPERFKYKAMIKPYVTIIQTDSAYIMGRFHKWTKAQAKIKKISNGQKFYKVLAISYETMTFNGKLFQEWTAVIPDPDNKNMMNDAKKWVNRINKQSREFEKAKKEKKIYSARIFDRMMGRNQDTEQQKKVSKPIEETSDRSAKK